MSEMSPKRDIPWFVERWRSEFVPGNLTPCNFIDRDAAVPYVIAAQWLFDPDFVEYRGCVFFEGNFSAAGVDDWFQYFENTFRGVESANELTVASHVESIVNHCHLYDVFGESDTDDYEDDLSQLARSLARCWQALARDEFPGRNMVATITDDEDSYGPTVTLVTRWPEDTFVLDPDPSLAGPPSRREQRRRVSRWSHFFRTRARD